jgi:hypothetical protein
VGNTVNPVPAGIAVHIAALKPGLTGTIETSYSLCAGGKGDQAPFEYRRGGCQAENTATDAVGMIGKKCAVYKVR